MYGASVDMVVSYRFAWEKEAAVVDHLAFQHINGCACNTIYQTQTERRAPSQPTNLGQSDQEMMEGKHRYVHLVKLVSADNFPRCCSFRTYIYVHVR